jgi:hypothetical protein
MRQEMSTAAFYKPRLYTAFHDEYPEAHEMSLGPTKVPNAGTRDTGTTTLHAQRALEDPNVEYFAHAGPEMLHIRGGTITCRVVRRRSEELSAHA